MTLLYHLGEGASEEALKPGTGIIAQLAIGAAAVTLFPTYARIHVSEAPSLPQGWDDVAVITYAQGFV